MALIRLVSKENFVNSFVKFFSKIFDTCPNFPRFWTHPNIFYCYCDEQFYEFHLKKKSESINVRVAYDISLQIISYKRLGNIFAHIVMWLISSVVNINNLTLSRL